jgi:ribosomal protein L40E
MKSPRTWERTVLVYCTKCGTKNTDDATVCAKCGASLQLAGPKREYRSQGECFGPSGRREMETGCFGLPYGGAIVGIIFGLIVIFIGLAILSGINIWTYLGPLILVIVGILIVVGALYGMRRR